MHSDFYLLSRSTAISLLVIDVPLRAHLCFSFFFFNDAATTEIYTLSLHDALPISLQHDGDGQIPALFTDVQVDDPLRSEEHTSELQSHSDLVCRLLLEKKKKNKLYSQKPKSTAGLESCSARTARARS